MNAELYFTAGDFAPEAAQGKTAVVIDVLRATSVIVTAVSHGAAAVVPFGTVELARAYAEGASVPVALGGERGAVKIDGFDYGNSPLEYRTSLLAGVEVALTTTNGTRALTRARDADTLYVLCMRNIGAAVDRVASDGQDIVVVCAGTCGRFSADDALCAGIFLDRLLERTGARLDDAGQFAADYARMGLAGGREPAELLSECAHLKRLREKGFDADIVFCFDIDADDTVPVMRDGRIK